MGWLSGWSYRKSHTINYASGAGTNYQVRIVAHYGSGTDSGADVYLGGKCRTDFGDVRFTDDDGETLLDYWMETKVDGDYAVFWVEVADDLSSSSATIYVYYGKSDATTTSNGENTFLFFDDFNSGLSKWTQRSGSWTTSDGNLVSPIQDDAQIVTNSFSVYNVRIRAYFKITWVSAKNALAIIARTPNSSNLIKIQYQPGATSPEFNMFKRISGLWTKLDYEYITADQNYHTYEFLLYNSNLKGYRDGTSEITGTESTLTSNPIGLRHGGINSNSQGYVDWVFAAKYVSPEPSHGSWGNEETPGGGQTYEISVDAIVKTLSTPAYKITYNISKNAAVINQDLTLHESSLNILKDASLQVLTDIIVEKVVGAVCEIFLDAIAAAQAIFTFESLFNISSEATAQSSATVGVETIFNLVKDAVVKSSAAPQIVGIYPINKDALAGASATLNIQQTLGINKDTVIVSVSTPLTQSTFNINPLAAVKLFAEVAVVKEGEVKVTKLFLIIGDLAIQIQGD